MPAAAGAGWRPPRGIWLQTGCRDVQVTANRFVTAPGVTAIDVAPGQQSVTFKSNEYLTPDGAPVGAGKFAVQWQGRSYISLQAWKAESGQEPSPTAQGGPTVRPGTPPLPSPSPVAFPRRIIIPPLTFLHCRPVGLARTSPGPAAFPELSNFGPPGRLFNTYACCAAETTMRKVGNIPIAGLRGGSRVVSATFRW